MPETRFFEDLSRQALCGASQALDTAERHGRPHEMSAALAALGRAYAGLGVLSSAESAFEQALRWARATGSTDGVVDLLCALADAAAHLAEAQEAVEAGLGHAARERARDHVFEASTLAARVADAGWEVKVLLRISDVLDRCGDREDAVNLQTRALRLMSGTPHSDAHDPSQLPALGRLADA